MVIFLSIIHVLICLFLVLVVLLQQGKGGGLGASFGGSGAGQVFGGGGAGNLLTRTTAICATLFMLTSVSLAYISTSGDRALRDRAKLEEQQEKKDTATKPREKDEAREKEDAPKNDAAGTVPSAQTP